MYVKVYRLECLSEKLNRVNVGPFRSYDLQYTVDKMSGDGEDGYSDLKKFPSPKHDKLLKKTIVDNRDIDENMVCALTTLRAVDHWFPNRHKFKGKYRLVKYAVHKKYLTKGRSQSLIDSRHARQIAVIE